MFDSHAHVAFEQFNQDRKEIILRAEEAGVEGWLEVGANIKSSEDAIKLAKTEKNVFASVGVHPDHINELQEKDWQTINKLVQEPDVKAIGEIGFDYFRGGKHEEQLPAVQKFTELAITNNLPIIWHVRSSEDKDAPEDLLSFLKSLPDDSRPSGVSHTFSGTIQQAQAFVELELYIGISGIITFKNAGQLVDVVKAMPLEKLLIETDCPYLAPEPHRGQRNEPSYVKYVAKKIAEIKGISAEEVKQITHANTRKLFSI